MANNETGIIDEEFRLEYVVDRVHTTMTVWQGRRRLRPVPRPQSTRSRSTSLFPHRILNTCRRRG